MEPPVEETRVQLRSGIRWSNPEEMGFGFLQVHDVVSTQTPSETAGSSFTALLALPPPQAVELLVNEDFRAKTPPPIFPSNTALIDRASKFSVFDTAAHSPEGKSVMSGSCSMKPDAVKQEPLVSDSHLNSSMPAASDQSPKSLKRKEKEKKVINETNKKSKKVVPNDISEGSGEKLPYIHVRARRGQATDSHSLAERARREKINARMKLLQELVPGCNKISGTAMVLEEIINHVQALQQQVEFLSMRLAAVNPRSDINLDAFLAEKSEPAVDNYQSMFTASMWPEGQISGSRQQYQQSWHFEGHQQPIWGRKEDNSNLSTPENSLLTFDSLSNSGTIN